jgi:GR25 family glycosyltransferase involved in LPS biosynthesis
MSTTNLAVVVLADKGQQEMVDQHISFWARHPEQIFVFSHTHAVVSLAADTCPELSKRKQPVNLLEYAGGWEDVIDAIATDDQLKTFDAYAFFTPNTVCLRPDQFANQIGNACCLAKEPTVWNVQSEPVIWNRAAVTLAHQQLSQVSPSPSWHVYITNLLKTSKINHVAALPNAVYCGATLLLEAGKLVQKQKAILCTAVTGPAALSFLLTALEDVNPHPPQPDSKMVPRVLKEARVVVPNNEMRRDMAAINRGEEITFVTAFIDIRSREPMTPEKKVCKTAADYMRYGQRLLEWDVNLFLVVEPNMVADIWKTRDKLGLRHKTFIYPLTIEQSRFYPIIPKLQKLYDTGKVPKIYWAPKDTPLYVFSQMHKVDALRRAMDLNLFQSSKFYWIDYGIYHIAQHPAPTLEYFLAQLSAADHDRVRCRMLRHIKPSEVVDPAVFYSQLQQCIAGGLLGGKTEVMRWFVDEWEKEIHLATNYYPVLDQAIFGRLFIRNPEKFLPINGFSDGHRRILQPRPLQETITDVRIAIKEKRWDDADSLLQEIVPRPWTKELWTDAKSQLECLELVAQVDKAKINTIHPHTANTLLLLKSSWNSSQQKIFAELMPMLAAATPTVKPPEVKDLPLDVEMMGRMMDKLKSWVDLFRDKPDMAKSEVAKVHAFVADFAARKSVVESFPCLNVMLEALAATRPFGDHTKPLKKIPVWVLNLDRRPDRWQAMQRTFANLGPDRNELFAEFRRFSAVDGKKDKAYLMSLPIWNRLTKLHGRYDGAIACMASHMKMWEEWANLPVVDGNEWLMISEDDSVFGPSFLRDITGLSHLMGAGGGKSFSKVYHFVWSGYHAHVKDRWMFMYNTEPMKLMKMRENLLSQSVGGTHSYLVSKDGARLALKLLKEGYNLKDEPIDVWLQRHVHDVINHICPSHPIVFADFWLPGDKLYDGDISAPNNAVRK